MNNYEIIDEYGYDKDYSYLSKVMDYCLAKLAIEKASFSIIFIDDDKMRTLNREYRGLDRTTDVLSFALEDNQEIICEERILGDIYISIPKMIEQAKVYEHSEKRELSFLALHGLLHLLGYDHTRSLEEEKRQFGLQEAILQELNIVL